MAQFVGEDAHGRVLRRHEVAVDANAVHDQLTIGTPAIPGVYYSPTVGPDQVGLSSGLLALSRVDDDEVVHCPVPVPVVLREVDGGVRQHDGLYRQAVDGPVCVVNPAPVRPVVGHGPAAPIPLAGNLAPHLRLAVAVLQVEVVQAGISHGLTEQQVVEVSRAVASPLIRELHQHHDEFFLRSGRLDGYRLGGGLEDEGHGGVDAGVGGREERPDDDLRSGISDFV